MSLPSELAEGRDYESERLYDHRFGDVIQDPGPEVVPCNPEASERRLIASSAGPDGCRDWLDMPNRSGRWEVLLDWESTPETVELDSDLCVVSDCYWETCRAVPKGEGDGVTISGRWRFIDNPHPDRTSYKGCSVEGMVDHLHDNIQFFDESGNQANDIVCAEIRLRLGQYYNANSDRTANQGCSVEGMVVQCGGVSE